jgi:hypothetical protein
MGKPYVVDAKKRKTLLLFYVQNFSWKLNRFER